MNNSGGGDESGGSKAGQEGEYGDDEYYEGYEGRISNQL